MPTVLTPLDDDAVADRVLGVSRGLRDLIGADVRTVGISKGAHEGVGAAFDAMRGANEPVAVVPQGMRARGRQTFRRVLVPLEGDRHSSAPVDRFLHTLAGDGLDIAVLHAFTAASAPKMLDHPDVVVLAWSQDLSAGHAMVVREVLARSEIPILLLPDGPDVVRDDDEGGAPRRLGSPLDAGLSVTG